MRDLHPVVHALLATLFMWGMTAAGASLALVGHEFSRKALDGMLGFAAGVMIAASYWSLLAPAIEMSEGKALPAWFPAAAGFLLGGAFLWLVDRTLPHLHLFFAGEEAEGIHTKWRRTTLLVTAITLHNIPEGLAVSMPLRREGLSKRMSLWYGQLSATVEPVAAVLGAALVLVAMPVLPYALAFAAGAMIYVVVEEIVPESQRGGNTDFATLGAMTGFAVMMVLDVGLG